MHVDVDVTEFKIPQIQHKTKRRDKKEIKHKKNVLTHSVARNTS